MQARRWLWIRTFAARARGVLRRRGPGARVAARRRRRAGDHRAAERGRRHQPLRRPHGGGSVRRLPGREPRLQRLADRHGARSVSRLDGLLRDRDARGPHPSGRRNLRRRARRAPSARRRHGLPGPGALQGRRPNGGEWSPWSERGFHTASASVIEPLVLSDVSNVPPPSLARRRRKRDRPAAGRPVRLEVPGPGRSSRSSARTRASNRRLNPGAPLDSRSGPGRLHRFGGFRFVARDPSHVHGRERDGSRPRPSADRPRPGRVRDLLVLQRGRGVRPRRRQRRAPTLSEANGSRAPTSRGRLSSPASHRSRRHGFSASGQRRVRADPGRTPPIRFSTSRSSTVPSPSSRAPAPFRPIPRTCSTSIPSEVFPAPGRKARQASSSSLSPATSSSGRSRRSRASPTITIRWSSGFTARTAVSRSRAARRSSISRTTRSARRTRSRTCRSARTASSTCTSGTACSCRRRRRT